MRLSGGCAAWSSVLLPSQSRPLLVSMLFGKLGLRGWLDLLIEVLVYREGGIDSVSCDPPPPRI